MGGNERIKITLPLFQGPVSFFPSHLKRKPNINSLLKVGAGHIVWQIPLGDGIIVFVDMHLMETALLKTCCACTCSIYDKF